MHNEAVSRTGNHQGHPHGDHAVPANLPQMPARPKVEQAEAYFSAHSDHRFPAPSSKGRNDVVNQCLEFDFSAVENPHKPLHGVVKDKVSGLGTGKLKSKEVELGSDSRTDRLADKLFLNSCFSDTVFATLFRSAVETCC